MAKAEKFVIENLSIEDIIKDEFITKIKGLKKDIFPVSIVFVNEEKIDNCLNAYPIILSHVNKEEVKKKILHIESPNSELADSMTKIMEGENKNGKRK